MRAGAPGVTGGADRQGAGGVGASAGARVVTLAPPWPGPRAASGRPARLQQRSADPRSGPRARSRSGSGARSGPRSGSRAAWAGLRMFGTGGAGLAALRRARSRARAPYAASVGQRGAAAIRAPLRSRGAGGARRRRHSAGRVNARPGVSRAALRQRMAPRDGHRALRPLRGLWPADRGGHRKPVAAGARAGSEGSRTVSTPSRGRSFRRPPLPARCCHGDAWLVVLAPPAALCVTSQSRHLTSRTGGAAGRFVRGAVAAEAQEAAGCAREAARFPGQALEEAASQEMSWLRARGFFHLTFLSQKGKKF